MKEDQYDHIMRLAYRTVRRRTYGSRLQSDIDDIVQNIMMRVIKLEIGEDTLRFWSVIGNTLVTQALSDRADFRFGHKKGYRYNAFHTELFESAGSDTPIDALEARIDFYDILEKCRQDEIINPMQYKSILKKINGDRLSGYERNASDRGFKRIVMRYGGTKYGIPKLHSNQQPKRREKTNAS